MIPSRRLEHIFGSGYVLKSFVREGARSISNWNPIFRAGMHEAKNTAHSANVRAKASALQQGANR